MSFPSISGQKGSQLPSSSIPDEALPDETSEISSKFLRRSFEKELKPDTTLNTLTGRITENADPFGPNPFASKSSEASFFSDSSFSFTKTNAASEKKSQTTSSPFGPNPFASEHAKPSLFPESSFSFEQTSTKRKREDKTEEKPRTRARTEETSPSPSMKEQQLARIDQAVEDYYQQTGGKRSLSFPEVHRLSLNIYSHFKPFKTPYSRYTNIFPWSHNCYNKTDDTKCFPASLMTLADRSYYACEAPTVNNFSRFWHMVWDTGTENIAMLTNLREKGNRKADQYWPDDKTLNHGDLFITPENKEYFAVKADKISAITDASEIENLTQNPTCEYLIKTAFILKKNGEEKTIHHYHYHNWPDMGVAKEHELIHFLHEELNTASSKAAPIIHCSAGVGRTGAFIAYDSLLSEGKSDDEAIAKRILEMRFYRPLMVQKTGQFAFIGQAIQKSVEKRSTSR